MKRIILVLAVSLIVAGLSFAAEPVKSTLADQKELYITIYNSNLGLVKDIREISLVKGISELQFMDVAERINPTTVHIKSLIEPNSLSVLEQNYEYDLLNPSKLLDKYVGQKVKLSR